MKPAAPLEPPEGTVLYVHAVLWGLGLADPGITTEPRGLTETQSWLADLFTAAAVPGRSAALDVCVAPSNAAASRGDAAQAAFDRKTSHYRSPRPACPRHRLSSPGLDSRRSTTPSSFPNPTVRSGHRSKPQRTANVSKSPPAQMQTRNSESPPPTKSSHDTSSPTEHNSKRTVSCHLSHRQSHQPLVPSTPARWRRRQRRGHRNGHSTI